MKSLRILIPFLFLFLAVGCKGKPDVDDLVEPVPVMPRYLALGDSYTAGQGVVPTDRFPVKLSQRLGLSNPVLIARTGWTTRDLSTGMYEAKLTQMDYALVTLLVGVNDEFRGGKPEHYMEDFNEVYDRAVEHARGEPGRVVVISIPDYSVTPVGTERNKPETAARIDQYNEIAKAIATDGGSLWVDVTGISREHPEMLVDDGLHPSPEQYELWVDRLAEKIGEVQP